MRNVLTYHSSVGLEFGVVLAQGPYWGCSKDIGQSYSHRKARLGLEDLLLKSFTWLSWCGRFLTMWASPQCSWSVLVIWPLVYPQSKWPERSKYIWQCHWWPSLRSHIYHFCNIFFNHIRKPYSVREGITQGAKYKVTRIILKNGHHIVTHQWVRSEKHCSDLKFQFYREGYWASEKGGDVAKFRQMFLAEPRWGVRAPGPRHSVIPTMLQMLMPSLSFPTLGERQPSLRAVNYNRKLMLQTITRLSESLCGARSRHLSQPWR